MSLPLRTLDRRLFLRHALAWSVMAGPWAAIAAEVEQRQLSFLHTHTGEKLEVRYFHDGEYDAGALASLNHFLRDFRTGDMTQMDRGLFDILFDLQVLSGHEGTYEIISAYRSPATNAKLREKSTGVAENSLHMQGKAMDVRLAGFPTRKLHELALSLQRGGVGFYAASDFVHVDTGRVRHW